MMTLKQIHNQLFTSALHALHTLLKIEVTIKKRQGQSFKLIKNLVANWWTTVAYWTTCTVLLWNYW